MSFSFQAGAAQGQLTSLQQAVRDAVRSAVDAGADAALAIPPPYGGPHEFGGEGTIPDTELRSSVRQRAGGAEVDFAVVYDWVLSPFAHHCRSADGLDFPTNARQGPYTARTLPAQPRDGTTPCGQGCGCQLLVRDPPWVGDPEPVTETMAGVLDAWIQGR